MKKNLLFLLATILSSCLLMQAKDFNGAKIYINAGHGGWNEVNDRHVVTIPFPQYDSKGHWDTLGFWESSSNLKVAMDLREMLESRGAVVKMSRVTNQSGTRDNGAKDWDGSTFYTEDAYVGDRSLSMIAREASEWEADVFVSIHTNAAGSVGKDVNYLLFFMPCDEVYKGSSWTFEHYRDPQDTTLGRIMWPYMHDNDLDVWCENGQIGGTPKNPRMPSTHDYTLLQWGNLTVPGFIVEASFHSYLPNTHRYLNRDYQYMEALRFLYSYCAYFQADFPTTCCLTGDVRCPEYKFNVDNYKKYVDGSKDMYKPLNGVEVTLMQGDQQIDTYTTDNYYNGIYCFKEVTPGNYTIRFRYPNFNDTTIQVTAVAGKTICNNILYHDPNFDPYADKKLREDYPIWVKDFEWESTIEVLPATATDAKKTLDSRDIRRMQVLDSKIYILNQKGQIYTHSTESGKKGKTLSVVGVTGGTLKISDIFFTPDSMLVACNMLTMTQSDPTSKLNFYRWSNDDVDEPDLIFSVHSDEAMAGLPSATIGSTMAFSGNSWHSFQLYYPAISAQGDIYIVGIDYDSRAKGVTSGEIIATKYLSTGANTSAWGTNFTFRLSPMNEDAIIVESPTMQAVEIIFDWSLENGTTITDITAINKLSFGYTGLNFIKYGNRILLSSRSSMLPGAALYDITQGADKAQLLWDCADTKGSLTADFTQSAFIFGEDSALKVYNYAKGIGFSIHNITTYPATSVEEITSLNDLSGWVTVYSVQGMLLLQGDVSAISLPRGQVYLVRSGQHTYKLIY